MLGVGFCQAFITKNLMVFSFILLIVFYFDKPTSHNASEISGLLAICHHTTLKSRKGKYCYLTATEAYNRQCKASHPGWDYAHQGMIWPHKTRRFFCKRCTIPEGRARQMCILQLTLYAQHQASACSYA